MKARPLLTTTCLAWLLLPGWLLPALAAPPQDVACRIELDRHTLLADSVQKVVIKRCRVIERGG